MLLQRIQISLLIFLSNYILQGRQYKILAFLPFPTVSHHKAFLPLLNELSRIGHDVTYYTPVVPEIKDKNLTVKSIPPFKNTFTDKAAADSKHRTRDRKGRQYKILAFLPFPTVSHHKAFLPLLNELSRIGHDVTYYTPVVPEIKDKNLTVKSIPPFKNTFTGLPVNPAFQLDFKSRLSDEMSIMERIYNVYVTAASLAVSYYHMYAMQGIMDKYFNYTGWETRPPLQKLLINRSLILVNSDPVLSYPYPTAPHVKNIAGLNLMPNKPLPDDLEEYMNGSEKGVIYVSLGSNLNTSEIMRSKIGHSFLKIFENMPQRVIIKWEKEVEHSEMLQNVRTGNWFPQRDILAHKNCILFVTHGGFLSLTESVFYGVPVIGLPFFGDQPKNMIQVHKAGYGLMIKDDNISVHSLTWALKEVLSNPRYRNEAQRRSQMLRNRQHTPLAEAVYWVEHAIKYPNFLTPKSAFMSFWEKRIFDVGTFIIFIVSIISLFTTTMYISCKTNVRNKEQKAKLE